MDHKQAIELCNDIQCEIARRLAGQVPDKDARIIPLLVGSYLAQELRNLEVTGVGEGPPA
jgi:hypothetical protein